MWLYNKSPIIPKEVRNWVSNNFIGIARLGSTADTTAATVVSDLVAKATAAIILSKLVALISYHWFLMSYSFTLHLIILITFIVLASY